MRYRKHKLHHPTNGQRPAGLRIERWLRFSIYGIVAWLAASGVLWLVARYFMRPVSEFGEGVHPLEPWAMKLHGAGVLAALFFVGSLLNIHLRRAVKAGRNLFSGWSMLVLFAELTLTGYALYYLADEQNRPLWSLAHWSVGLVLPALLILHIVLGRKSSI